MELSKWFHSFSRAIKNEKIKKIKTEAEQIEAHVPQCQCVDNQQIMTVVSSESCLALSKFRTLTNG